MPVRVRLRVAALICLGAGAALWPWWVHLPIWFPPIWSLLVLGAGAYAAWCLWPRWTLGLGPRTLAELPVIPGQHVRLTFDDGPTPGLTDKVLDLLKERGVRASFFVLVAKARPHPELIRRIVAEGHTLGLHGERHTSPFFRSPSELEASLRSAHRDLEEMAGCPVELYRPSHGWKNVALVRALRRLPLRVANWHTGVWDTDAPPAGVLTARLWGATPHIPEAEPPVVLLHDGLDDDPAVPAHASSLLESLAHWLPPAQRPADRSRSRIWWRLAVAALWVTLAVVAVFDIDWPLVWRSFSAVPRLTIVALLVSAWLATVFQALRFFFLFPAGLGIARHIALNFALQAGNVVLPGRAGELVRPFYMKRWTPALSVPGLVAWSAIDKFAEVLALLPFVAAATEVLETDSRFAVLARWVWPALAVGALGLILLGRHWRRTARRHLDTKPSPRRLAASVGCSFVGWLFNFAIFWLVVPDIKLALALLIGVNLAAAIPGLPAGLGAFEAAFVWVGHMGGLPADRALALALVAHLAQVVATLSIGVPVLSRWGWPEAERTGIKGRTPARYRISNVFVFAAASVVVVAAGVLRRPAGRRRALPGPRASGESLRVALVSEFFYPTLGGIQDHLYNFSRELIRRGHRPTIVTPHVVGAVPREAWWPSDLPTSVLREVGTSVPYFTNGGLGRVGLGVGLGRELDRLLTSEHFDLVHLHSPLAGTLPILAAAHASVPMVGTIHTSFGTQRTLSLFRGYAQEQADALADVIAVSPISLASSRQYLRLDARLIPNGIDTATFRPRWEGPDDRVAEYADDRLNIFFIGRPDPRNGLDALIRAFARLHRAVPATRLIIAGDGGLMYRYRQMAATLVNDPEAVEFLGAVRDERPRLYRTADIQVFTVERAAFSVTLLEGMASGLPIVTTDWEGHEFMGVPGLHFETVHFDDDVALERHLVTLVADPARRVALGQQARAHALSYDWQIVTGRILDVYTDVLTTRAGC